MNRLFNNKNLLLCGILPSFKMDEADFEAFKQAQGLYIEDPWERVKAMFTTDEMGDFHPEMKYVIDITQVGLYTGAMYGGTIASVKQTDTFLRTNDTKIYSSTKEVYKVLANENMLAFVKGAIRGAPKFGIFFGGFTLISSCLELYRNKPQILDSSLAGFSIGALSRFIYGPKGMLSGGIVGAVLGTLYGTVIWARQTFTDADNIKIKYAHFAYIRHREMLKKGITEPEEQPKQEEVVAHNISKLDQFEIEEETQK